MNISQYLQENACVGVSFLIKMQTFGPAFQRTPVLKNICEPLFEHFPTLTNNIENHLASEGVRRRFLQKTKQKNHSKTQLVEQKLTFP